MVVEQGLGREDPCGSEAVPSGYMPTNLSEPFKLLLGPWKTVGSKSPFYLNSVFPESRNLVLESTLGTQADVSVLKEPCAEGKTETSPRFLEVHTGTWSARQ